MHKTPDHVIERIVELSLQGETTRRIRALTGAAKNTIHKYRHQADVKNMVCPCGKPVLHRGWCSDRYRKSPARQEFMAHWHKKSKDQELDETHFR